MTRSLDELSVRASKSFNDGLQSEDDIHNAVIRYLQYKDIEYQHEYNILIDGNSEDSHMIKGARADFYIPMTNTCIECKYVGGFSPFMSALGQCLSYQHHSNHIDNSIIISNQIPDDDHDLIPLLQKHNISLYLINGYEIEPVIESFCMEILR